MTLTLKLIQKCTLSQNFSIRIGYVHLYCSIMTLNHQKQKVIAKKTKTELTLSDWLTSTSSDTETGKQRAWEILLEVIVLIPNSWL